MSALNLINRRITLPSSDVNSVLGKVFYQKTGSHFEVTFTILMPRISEGCKTGVALDASSSMKLLYGKLPKSSGNLVEIEARKFLYYLADRLDADGETTAIYWACSGIKGIEVLGNISVSQCHDLKIEGPQEVDFGPMTNLLPALHFFVDSFPEASNGMYIFVTDGRIDDFLEVKEYCMELAKEINLKKRNPLKCVLIGIGERINTRQMQELDNLDSITGFDLWDYHVAKDMREITDIFAELVEESVMVAPMATIYDDTNTIIKQFTDGLPGRVTFQISTNSSFFELEVAGQRIRQNLTVNSRIKDKVN